jgi:hypothetical protein
MNVLSIGSDEVFSVGLIKSQNPNCSGFYDFSLSLFSRYKLPIDSITNPRSTINLCYQQNSFY